MANLWPNISGLSFLCGTAAHSQSYATVHICLATATSCGTNASVRYVPSSLLQENTVNRHATQLWCQHPSLVVNAWERNPGFKGTLCHFCSPSNNITPFSPPRSNKSSDNSCLCQNTANLKGGVHQSLNV